MERPELPVIFKKHFWRDIAAWEIMAFFPTLPFDRGGHEMTCYAHVGQHGGAAFDFFWSGKKVQPVEYDFLLKELKGIYETDDEPVTLVVHTKMSRKMRDAFDAEVRRLRA